MSSEPHPILMMLLENSTFVGMSESVENEIMPLPEQLNFGTGDAALVAAANTPLERDFAVARGVDPTKHADLYPDWEERMLNSFVLCEVFSRMDPEITLGWYSRLKLLPISTYRYRQCRKWLKDGFPDLIPAWAEEVYMSYTERLSEYAPNTVPKAATCEKCGSKKVELKISRRITYTCRAGTVQMDGKIMYLPVREPEETGSHVARLHCAECLSFADLDDDEWILPGLSN